VTRGSVAGVLGRAVAHVLLAGYAVLCLYPFAWMVSASVKDEVEVRTSRSLVPQRPTWDTLVTTWERLDFFSYFVNSVLVTTATVLGVIAVYSLAAYAFAVLRFPGRRVLYGMFVALLFVPPVTVLLPIVILENRLGLLGTLPGLVLPFVNGAAPLAVLLLTASFAAVPRELHDAAVVDGAGHWRIFSQVYLPLVRPALVTIAVLTAVPTWNEYVLTRVSLNDPALFTLPIGLQNLLATNVPRYNEVMAGSLITVLPIILLFLLLQRFFVNGLTGAVKG
jgi:multiple sugar transport system permease protein